MSGNILARRTAHRWSVSSGLLFRAGLATLLFFMLTVGANAYTLVLRSGRVVTVSDNFKVTPTAFTYEASPGYWVTVWLSNVDIAATERANNEPAGSFKRRIEQEPEKTPAAAARVPQGVEAGRAAGRKVITNKELEPTRLMRRAQEEEYERTRRERGMPSRQEMQQRIEEHDRWLSEWAQRMQEERREAELESLRSELANVRLQLSELDFGLSQQGTTYVPAYVTPNYYPYFYAPPAQIINALPFGHRGLYGRAKFGRHAHKRSWLYQPRPGRHFPRVNRPFHGPGGLRRAMPPGMAAPRHAR
ncbi:MAG TPA: hypothetical protein VGB76_09405 [Pyrinomonadaceae bacterium]